MMRPQQEVQEVQEQTPFESDSANMTTSMVVSDSEDDGSSVQSSDASSVSASASASESDGYSLSEEYNENGLDQLLESDLDEDDMMFDDMDKWVVLEGSSMDGTSRVDGSQRLSFAGKHFHVLDLDLDHSNLF